MSSITKKQSSLALLVLVFVTILITGTILLSPTDNTVLAKRHHHIHQSIGQSNTQHQKAVCLTAGAASPVSASCNNIGFAANANDGGNGAVSHGGGSHSGSDQGIGQSNTQHQKAVCLTAGAASPITGACNNIGVEANANAGGNGAA